MFSLHTVKAARQSGCQDGLNNGPEIQKIKRMSLVERFLTKKSKTSKLVLTLFCFFIVK
jgi:hypothetical protein